VTVGATVAAAMGAVKDFHLGELQVVVKVKIDVDLGARARVGLRSSLTLNININISLGMAVRVRERVSTTASTVPMATARGSRKVLARRLSEFIVVK